MSDLVLSRRAVLAQLGVLALAGAWPRDAHAAADPVITVYKSRTCGCCTNWVRHMTASGFKVNAVDTDDVDAVKAQMGVRPQYASCHTGIIGKYIVEGHVPADLVKKMLKEQPVALGLAVPGMPVGSPGMEQGPPEHYDVMLLARDGSAKVYAKR